MALAKYTKSVLTEDMEQCFFTGSTNIEIHHIFYGTAYRKKSEQYGFKVPLRPDLHRETKYSVHGNPNNGVDLELKQIAQRYFEQNIGSRDLFRQEFGGSYL